MKRIGFLAYGILCYLLFSAVYVWMGAFAGNLFLPRTIDRGPSSSPLTAVTIDVLLILAFGLQHSIMARPAFKNLWTRLIPQPIERSTYVLASCLVTGLLLWQWRPIDTVVWSIPSGPGWWIMTGLFIFGWLMVPAVSLMINHFDLFGIRQVWLYFQGKPYTSLPFRTPLAYSTMRHPLYVGWAIFFWSTPVMTVGHILLAGLLTSYMLVAVVYEERDLIAHFGEEYRDYCLNVPQFIPRFSFGRKEELVRKQLVPAKENISREMEVFRKTEEEKVVS